MRFAFIIPARVSNGGGAERWAETVALNLSARGHSVDLYVPQDRSLSPYSGLAFQREIAFKSRLYNFLKRVRLTGYYPALMFVRLPARYDAVYSTSMFPILTFASVASPLIIGTHDAFISTSPISIDNFQLIPQSLYRFIRKGRQTIIHSLNALTTQKFRHAPWPVKEIPIFVSSIPIEPTDYELFRVVFIGTLERRKGADLLIGAISALSARTGTKFTVIGKIPPTSLKLYAKLREFPQFEHLGSLTNKGKFEVLATASLCLHLSRRETSPAVPLEALLAGVPVLSTWWPLSKILQSSGLQIVPENSRAVAEAIEANYARWNSSRKFYLDWRHKLQAEVTSKLERSDRLERVLQLLTTFGSQGMFQ